MRGLTLESEMKSGTTEAPVYQEAGMDTIVFGPGQAAGNIHSPTSTCPSRTSTDAWRSTET